MVAQRRRNNHLATTWTRSPRWNYSRFIPEAGMMKKKASGMISPPAGCREELQIPPIYRRWRWQLRTVSWKIDWVLRVLVSRASYRRRGRPRGCPRRLHPPSRGPGLSVQLGGVSPSRPSSVSSSGFVLPMVKY